MYGILSLIAACCMAVASPPTAQLSIDQQGVNIDEPIAIHVEGLAPLQEIELEAQAMDQKGECWTSLTFFQANEKGSVDVAHQRPLEGSSYENVDEMGIIWSMKPSSNNLSSGFKCKEDQFTVTFTLRQEGKIVGQETITRFLKAPGIRRVDVREDGIVGTLFIPSSEKPLPVIIVLNGSNGGLGENRAKLLASNGFATFALGYFGVDGLPSNLQDIPLEYFEEAFAWLKNRKDIDGSHVGLYGVSRGAELSLLLSAYFPDCVHAVVAIVPSSVAYGGLSETPVNGWIYRGQPILCAPVAEADFSHGKGQDAAHAVSTREYFLVGMQQKEAFDAAAIPVEAIRCPLFLISGGDDQMWPSDIFAEQVVERLQKHQSSILYQHWNYPAAGHGIGMPNLPIPDPIYYHPISKLWFSLGGSRAADAAASRDAWMKLVAFFHQTLYP